MGVIDKYLSRKIAEVSPPVNTQEIVAKAVSDFAQAVTPNRSMAPAVFGAGRPLRPVPINPPNADGTIEPRQFQFQTSTNINISGDRLIGFPILRQCASGIDILARCINLKKAKCLGWEWDIVLSDDATDRIMREQNVTRERAATIARESLSDEISRLKEFWKNPDPMNGLSFLDWFGIVLDEVFTIDALAIYPQKSVGGDLLGLQIIDGATIKPIIDDRGFRPQPPETAYQQLLWGYVRSDFLAPVEDEKADGTFASNELFYAIQNRRTTSMYGNSPTERALALADIYIRRQQWIRAEYTDGVTPDIFMQTSVEFGNDIEAMNAYEENFNDQLRGQTSARQGIRLLPAGMTPIQMQSYAERFKDVLDDWLMGAIASHYALQPTEIGLIPKHAGLGGAGLQQGQAESSNAMGDIPLQKWFAGLFTKITYMYLGGPRELEFKFTSQSREDALQIAQAEDIDLRNGKLTMNAARSRSGEPLIDSDQADQPIFVVGKEAFFLTEKGMVPFSQPQISSQVSPQVVDNTEQQDDVPVDRVVENEANKAIAELGRCIRWLKKSPTRPFNFEFVPKTYGEVINKFVAVGDYDSARWYAERYSA